MQVELEAIFVLPRLYVQKYLVRIFSSEGGEGQGEFFRHQFYDPFFH